ncbi:MAG: hypothetical protein AAGA56_27555 [Myxococcota bacterium]
MRPAFRTALIVVTLVAVSEALIQGMVQRPWVAQLLAPGGDVFTVILVAMALVTRLLVIVLLPGLLVAWLSWRVTRTGPPPDDAVRQRRSPHPRA